MSGYSVTAKSGRAIVGEFDAIFQPRIINGADRYGIVACHGAGGDWFQWMSQSFPRMHQLLVYAARGGVPSIAARLGAGGVGGDTWGNPAGTTNVGSALTALGAASGCSTDKVHLIGASAGASTMLNYAIANPAKVASITGLIPLTSLLNFYKTNPPAGTEANAVNARWDDIATAWGVAQRVVTDVVTDSTTTITSATANFTAGDNGKLIISKPTNGIAAGTTMTFVNSTTATLSAPATTTGTGRIVGIGAQLPAGADLLANASALNGIPARLYYAPDDTTIDPNDVTAMATAMGGMAVAIPTNGGGHTDAGLLPTAFDFNEWVAWLIQNGG